MEVPIHEYTYMDIDAERMVTTFRVIVGIPGSGFEGWKYIYASHWADEPEDRDTILDSFIELFVMFYDAGYTEIVDYFLPKDT